MGRKERTLGGRGWEKEKEYQGRIEVEEASRRITFGRPAM